MILIIGGAYQGKFEYAKANFKEGHQIINNFHKYVRKTMQQGGDPELEAKQLMNKAVLAGNADKLVLVSDEVGSGIVPIDAFEREFRACRVYRQIQRQRWRRHNGRCHRRFRQLHPALLRFY